MESLHLVSIQLLIFAFCTFAVVTTAIGILAYNLLRRVNALIEQANKSVAEATAIAAKMSNAHNQMVTQYAEQAKKIETLQMQVGGLKSMNRKI